MPDFRRAYRPGGTFFFTLVTEGRADILCTDLARSILRRAIADCLASRPFSAEAMVLLPDHLHAMWTLPPGDSDYSTRWAAIKAKFTHDWLAAGGVDAPARACTNVAGASGSGGSGSMSSATRMTSRNTSTTCTTTR